MTSTPKTAVRGKSPRAQHSATTTTPVETPTAPLWASLSFVKMATHEGHSYASEWFAVPLEEYGPGWTTGYKAVAELFALLKAHRGQVPPFIAQRIVQAVAEELAKPPSEGPSKRGAACAFMETIGHVLKSTDMVHIVDNGYCTVQHWVQHQIQEMERLRVVLAKEDAQRRKAFVERMKVSLAPKRQAWAAAKRQTRQARAGRGQHAEL